MLSLDRFMLTAISVIQSSSMWPSYKTDPVCSHRYFFSDTFLFVCVSTKTTILKKKVNLHVNNIIIIMVYQGNDLGGDWRKKNLRKWMKSLV